MKLLFDESLSPRLVPLLRDLFPESESALRNGLARIGDRRILEYAAAHDFVLVSTDSDFERLLKQFPGVKVVILRSCDYPTEIAADVLRRNAIRIAELPTSHDQLIILDLSFSETRSESAPTQGGPVFRSHTLPVLRKGDPHAMEKCLWSIYASAIGGDRVGETTPPMNRQ